MCMHDTSLPSSCMWSNGVYSFLHDVFFLPQWVHSIGIRISDLRSLRSCRSKEPMNPFPEWICLILWWGPVRAPWPEWSKITDPDPGHLNGTHSRFLFSSPFRYFNTDILFSVTGACFYFLLVASHAEVAHLCQTHGSAIQSTGWLPKVEAPATLETPNLYLGNAVVKSRLKSPATRSTLLQLHSQAFFWSVRMNTRTTSVDRMMTVFLDLLPCTINLSFKIKIFLIMSTSPSVQLDFSCSVWHWMNCYP